MKPKSVASQFLRGVLLAALVFLPVFFFMVAIELSLAGGALTPWRLHVGAALLDYISLFPAVVGAAIIHAGLVMLFPSRTPQAIRVLAAGVLAVLLPAGIVLAGNGFYLGQYPRPLVAATVAYGLCCARALGSSQLPRTTK